MTLRRRLAVWIVRYARHLLPRGQHEWGAAMQAEMIVIADDSAALRWALGAWRAAWLARARMVCGSPPAHLALALVISFEGLSRRARYLAAPGSGVCGALAPRQRGPQRA